MTTTASDPSDWLLYFYHRYPQMRKLDTVMGGENVFLRASPVEAYPRAVHDVILFRGFNLM